MTVYPHSLYWSFQIFFLFSIQLHVIHLLKVADFSCGLVSLYPPVHFLSMWFSSPIAVTNTNGDSASPWKIPHRIFTSAKFFLVFSFTIQFSWILGKHWEFVGYLVHFETVCYPALQYHIICLFVVKPRQSYIFSFRSAPFVDALIIM